MSKNERKDAYRVKDVDGFHSIIPYMMPKRTEAEVSLNETFDITDLLSYMKARNEAEGLKLKLFHAICTAVARTIYLRPKMNIFIAGRRYWMRKDITLSFVAKRVFNDESEESLMFVKVKPDMTLDSISKMILGDVEKVRSSGSNDLDKLMTTLGRLPRFLLALIFKIVGRLEFYGVMPASLSAGDPNYSTVLLSNLGSIGCGAPYHHLSNYGTNSIMITIGNMHKERRFMADGSEQVRDVVGVQVTLDERIADGFYFARSLRLTKYMLEHPACLEETVETPLPQEAENYK